MTANLDYTTGTSPARSRHPRKLAAAARALVSNQRPRADLASAQSWVA